MPKNPKKLFRALVLSAALGAPLLGWQASGRAESPAEVATREIEVVVDAGAYKPNRIEVHEGERVRLRFVRKEYGPCTKEVVFPALGIRRELPTNTPVVIELPSLKAGEYEFKCGMNMVRGTIVVMGHHHG
jgi:plastocyanin domain-containing protein